MDLFNLDDRYKFELQVDQRNKTFNGVTYSYKTTVFYGKASANGTVNTNNGKVLLNEIKIVEVRMAEDNYACIMRCFLQYTKNGDEEFLEGKYSSYRESDSSNCGKGTVFLRKVTTSDFYKEPFLVKREEEAKKKLAATKTNKTTSPTKTQPLAKNNTTTKNTTKANTKPATKTTTPPVNNNKDVASSEKQLNTKSIPSITKTDAEKRNDPAKKIVIVPKVLSSRENEVVKTIVIPNNEIIVKLYDNGTIDHDTVSVYLDKKLVISRQMLTTQPITVKLTLDEENPYHELVMVAENLGEIPPNTSLMVVSAGDKQYEVRITSTEQKNAVVIFKYEKPK